jgi:hypothetical protein
MTFEGRYTLGKEVCKRNCVFIQVSVIVQLGHGAFSKVYTAIDKVCIVQLISRTCARENQM